MRLLELEDAHDLRGAARAVRAGATQDLREALQVAVVAVDQLHLELGEAAGGASCIEDVDTVEHDIGDRPVIRADADADPTRTERCHRLQPAVAEVCGEEGGELRWRAG